MRSYKDVGVRITKGSSVMTQPPTVAVGGPV